METIPRHDWTPPNDREPIQPLDMSGIELPHLTGYLMLAILVTVCLLTSAWSRLNFRELAVALDQAQTSYDSALSEQAQLRLELASLSDPHWIQQVATDLELQTDVQIIDIPTRAIPASR